MAIYSDSLMKRSLANYFSGLNYSSQDGWDCKETDDMSMSAVLADLAEMYEKGWVQMSTYKEFDWFVTRFFDETGTVEHKLRGVNHWNASLSFSLAPELRKVIRRRIEDSLRKGGLQDSELLGLANQLNCSIEA